ncbi:MAG: NAD(P)H-binding protein [Pseudomonadota bacterium]
MAAPAPAQPTPRTAILAGASGVTGNALLRLLLRQGDHARVLALTRRPLPLEHPRLANRVLRFEELATRLTGTRCDDAFCCLGAAQGPRATSEELRRVDLQLALAFARAARAAGATRLVLVSAAGADPRARGDFLRTKGELEVALRELKYPALDIVQPGAVVGERPTGGAVDTLRAVVAPLVNLALQGKLAESRWISGADLALAMVAAARGQRVGVNSYSGIRLMQLTRAASRAG